MQQSVRPASSARSSAAGEDDLVSPLHMGQRFFLNHLLLRSRIRDFSISSLSSGIP